ncbi:MAG: hypothetical protein ABIH35_04170 [Patescibacteria group bacterium]
MPNKIQSSFVRPARLVFGNVENPEPVEAAEKSPDEQVNKLKEELQKKEKGFGQVLKKTSEILKSPKTEKGLQGMFGVLQKMMLDLAKEAPKIAKEVEAALPEEYRSKEPAKEINQKELQENLERARKKMPEALGQMGNMVEAFGKAFEGISKEMGKFGETGKRGRLEK